MGEQAATARKSAPIQMHHTPHPLEHIPTWSRFPTRHASRRHVSTHTVGHNWPHAHALPALMRIAAHTPYTPPTTQLPLRPFLSHTCIIGYALCKLPCVFNRFNRLNSV